MIDVISLVIIYVKLNSFFNKKHLPSKHPRWSTGHDSALSQPRTGFDSPAGNSFLARWAPIFFYVLPPTRAGTTSADEAWFPSIEISCHQAVSINSTGRPGSSRREGIAVKCASRELRRYIMRSHMKPEWR